MLFSLEQIQQEIENERPGNFSLNDLLETSKLQILLEAHHRITGLPYGVFDKEENCLMAVGWQDICVRFHRVHPACSRRCRESDAYIKAHLHNFKGDFLEYRCKNGMVDVAVPVIISGEHALSLFTGQFFFDDDLPDFECFRAQAEEFGFDQDEYLEALGRVPVVTREQVGVSMSFLSTLVGVLSDIGLNNQRLKCEVDARNRIESALRKSETNLKTILQSIIDPMSLMNRERKIVWANDKAHEIFGNDIVGRACHSVFRGRDMPCTLHSCAVQRAFDEGKGVEASTALKVKTGEKRFFSRLVNVAKWDSNGQPELVLEISRDITDRKHKEDQLRESESRYSRAEEIAHLGYLERDLITDMVRLSDESWRIFGEKPRLSLVTFRTIMERIHPEDREMVIKAYSEQDDRQSTFSLTYRILRPGGEIRYVHDRSRTEFAADGRPLRSVGTLQDITERRFLEEQLNHARRMEAVGQLAGGIAHDFNNIITSIIGFSFVIQQRLGKESPLYEYVEHISFAAERAASLTSDLLDFSRKKDVQLYPFDLNEGLRKANTFLARLLREDIELRLHCSDSRLVIRGNEGQLLQIFMNLATNARDALPEGGVISINTASVVLDKEFIHLHGFGSEGRFALLTFADTGIGMDEGTRRRIFEPFFTTKEVGKGTGLGLATVFGIVEHSEGHINVYSEPGKGTIFRIYLPEINTEQQIEQLSEKMTLPKVTGETILLAEDDSGVREISELMLREAGFTVISAKNGKEAVEIFLEFRDEIDLLILDTVMPEKNGLEVYLRAEQLKPAIKVLFMSGYTEDFLGFEEIGANRHSFLQKPVNPNEFIRVVREILVS